MTQALFQGGSEFWPSWNARMREALVRNQQLDGHWTAPPGSQHEQGAHYDVYNTALGALMLETYYRYLPMYDVLAQQKKGRK